MTGGFTAGTLPLVGHAARVLGWRPDEFWSATPAELRAALLPPDNAAAIGRDQLKRMMDRDNG